MPRPESQQGDNCFDDMEIPSEAPVSGHCGGLAGVVAAGLPGSSPVPGMCSLDATSSSMQSQSCTLSESESSVGFGITGEEPPVRPCALPAVPDCFRCPISQQIMEDPVALDDGRTYDRSSVASLGYEGNLVPNVELKEAMEGYFALFEDTERRQHDWMQLTVQHEQKLARKLAQRKKQVRALKEGLDHMRRRGEELGNGRKVTVSPLSAVVSSVVEEQGHGFCTEAGGEGDVVQQEFPCQPKLEAVVFKAGRAPRPVEAAAAAPHRPSRSSTWSRLLSGGRLAGAAGGA